ncbi:MAG: hypothetical protein LBF68_03370 [Christensenellaceae bacterium]|jgi:hypothetical protein|nr:hypothetical protein [Christensenellaceae bacterium]
MAQKDLKNQSQPQENIPSFGVGAGIPTINVPVGNSPGTFNYISPRQLNSPYWRAVTGSISARGANIRPGYSQNNYYTNQNYTQGANYLDVDSKGRVRTRKKRTGVLILMLIIFIAANLIGLYPGLIGLSFTNDDGDGIFIANLIEVVMLSITVEDYVEGDSKLLDSMFSYVPIDILQDIKVPGLVIGGSIALIGFCALVTILALLISLFSKHCSRIALRLSAILNFLGVAGLIVGVYLIINSLGDPEKVNLMNYLIMFKDTDFDGYRLGIGAYALFGGALLSVILSFFAFKKNKLN